MTILFDDEVIDTPLGITVLVELLTGVIDILEIEFIEEVIGAILVDAVETIFRLFGNIGAPSESNLAPLGLGGAPSESRLIISGLIFLGPILILKELSIICG